MKIFLLGVPWKKNCIHRGHYFVFCAGVGILTTASDHNFASNFFYVAWKHSIHVICDIDHWQKKVLISQDVFICVVHYSNVITGNLFLLTYYNYSHFFFIPDIVYINLISWIGIYNFKCFILHCWDVIEVSNWYIHNRYFDLLIRVHFVSLIKYFNRKFMSFIISMHFLKFIFEVQHIMLSINF